MKPPSTMSSMTYRAFRTKIGASTVLGCRFGAAPQSIVEPAGCVWHHFSTVVWGRAAPPADAIPGAGKVTKARVLTIEDDPMTANEIVVELEQCGFAVEWVSNGRDGLVRAMGDEHDIITLDRMLPGLDGLTILTTMRTVGIQTPVLMLSALGDVDERVRGLRAGGDDYLTKPFDPDELTARVDVLLRRRSDQAPKDTTTLEVGPLKVDLVSRKVTRDEVEVALLPTEYRILEFMIRHSGQTITRTMLFEAVWGYHFDPGTNLIDVHMGRLRRKIDPQGARALIQTVRGSGYILA
jgi:two-component system, OmpR family, response regulator